MIPPSSQRIHYEDLNGAIELRDIIQRTSVQSAPLDSSRCYQIVKICKEMTGKPEVVSRIDRLWRWAKYFQKRDSTPPTPPKLLQAIEFSLNFAEMRTTLSAKKAIQQLESVIHQTKDEYFQHIIVPRLKNLLTQKDPDVYETISDLHYLFQHLILNEKLAKFRYFIFFLHFNKKNPRILSILSECRSEIRSLIQNPNSRHTKINVYANAYLVQACTLKFCNLVMSHWTSGQTPQRADLRITTSPSTFVSMLFPVKPPPQIRQTVRLSTLSILALLSDLFKIFSEPLSRTPLCNLDIFFQEVQAFVDKQLLHPSSRQRIFLRLIADEASYDDLFDPIQYKVYSIFQQMYSLSDYISEKLRLPNKDEALSQAAVSLACKNTNGELSHAVAPTGTENPVVNLISLFDSYRAASTLTRNESDFPSNFQTNLNFISDLKLALQFSLPLEKKQKKTILGKLGKFCQFYGFRDSLIGEIAAFKKKSDHNLTQIRSCVSQCMILSYADFIQHIKSYQSQPTDEKKQAIIRHGFVPDNLPSKLPSDPKLFFIDSSNLFLKDLRELKSFFHPYTQNLDEKLLKSNQHLLLTTLLLMIILRQSAKKLKLATESLVLECNNEDISILGIGLILKLSSWIKNSNNFRHHNDILTTGKFYDFRKEFYPVLRSILLDVALSNQQRRFHAGYEFYIRQLQNYISLPNIPTLIRNHSGKDVYDALNVSRAKVQRAMQRRRDLVLPEFKELLSTSPLPLFLESDDTYNTFCKMEDEFTSNPAWLRCLKKGETCRFHAYAEVNDVHIQVFNFADECIFDINPGGAKLIQIVQRPDCNYERKNF